MQWHNYPTYLRCFAEASRVEHLPPDQMLNSVIGTGFRSKVAQNSKTLLYGESKWMEASRPYYDLYPSVAEAFTKVDLGKLLCDNVHLPIPQLMIRQPIGKELQVSKAMKLQSIFAMELPVEMSLQKERSILISISDGTVEEIQGHRMVIHNTYGLVMASGKTFADRLVFGRANPYVNDICDEEAIDNAFRIVCAIALLKSNPDFIEPVPLESDREKWERTHDIKLIEKAARRGKRGWTIGRHIEAAPGFRNPHFAIRWMGKGRVDPQLRPIKGCLVRRKQIEDVPTDWLGPEQTV